MIKIYKNDKEYIAFSKSAYTSTYLSLRALFNFGYWIYPKTREVSEIIEIYESSDFRYDFSITEYDLPNYEEALRKYPEHFL